jgi:hypothetical protein
MPGDSDFSKRQLLDLLFRDYESKGLDYKAPSQWNEGDKKACCELVKDILGMANSEGGFIIIGVSETPSGFSRDGLTTEQLKTFDTSRINRFVQNYADPPINARLRKLEHQNKTYVIIEVPQFPDTPHICQKDFPDVLKRGTLYVRTDNNESAPLLSSSDFRAIIERAVRNRSDALLSAVRSILTTGVRFQPAAVETAEDRAETLIAAANARFEELNPLKTAACAGFFQSTFWPEHLSDSHFSMEQLREAVRRGSVDFRGWPYLYFNPNKPERTYAVQDGLETFVHSKDFGGDDLVDFWRLQQSGFFYQETAMRPLSLQRSGETRCVVDFREIAVYIAQAIHCLTRLYDTLLDDEELIHFRLTLVGTSNRLLVSTWPMTMPLLDQYVCRVPDVIAGGKYPLSDWRAGMIDHALEIAGEVYTRFNWLTPNLGAARTAIEKLFARSW